MAKQFKESVMIGTDSNGKPIYRWATGYSKRDLHLSIARIIMEAGMLGEVTPRDNWLKRRSQQ